MSILSYPTKSIILAWCLVFGNSALAAAETPEGNRGYVVSNPTFERTRDSGGVERLKPLAEEKKLTPLQQQARTYRQQGTEYQRVGKLDEALVLYEKAIQLDPMYAVAYNDAGIIFEAKGQTDRAQASYIQAIKISPQYLSPYSNLAMLYEVKRDLVLAAFYWGKRAMLGPPDDPWTVKAKQRFDDIRLVLGVAKVDTREQEILDFMNEALAKKNAAKEEAYSRTRTPREPTIPPDAQRAKDFFWKAKLSYEVGDYELALKEAVNAHLLDPSNDAITEFMDKLQTLVLSK